MTPVTTQAAPETKTQWRNIRFEVLEKIESLPSLSNVVTEFLILARRDFFSAKDFEKVISKDQALVARLLKVANSGLYGRSRSIHSIPEAVVLIGLDNLKKIVYAVSSEGLTRRSLIHYGYHQQQGFWCHAMGVGLTARILTEASPKSPLRGEEAFVAGLLHDVGKLVIDGFLPGDVSPTVTRDEEIEAVGMDHAELAEYILKQWNLPEAIATTVRHHHEYTDEHEFGLGSAALALAEGLCGVWGVGRQNPVDLSQDINTAQFAELIHHLGLQDAKWDRILWDVRQNLVSLEDLFLSE